MSIRQPVASDFAEPASDAEPVRVVRSAELSPAEFRREFAARRRPLLFADAAAAWPLHARGTPDHFRSRHGDHVVRVLGQDCRLAELIDRLEASTPEKPGPYPCKYEIARDFRELLPEVSPRFAYSLPDRQASSLIPQNLFADVNNLEIFFGGPGGRFPYLHYDVMRLHAWITQLHGDKEFTLYAPGQEEFLYINPDMPWQSAIRNHHNPDFTRYPLFRNARAQKVVLRAGQTLFLPCGWWHTARSLTMTISVAFDQLGPDNWRDFIGDVASQQRREGRRLNALAHTGWLRAIGPMLALTELFGANSHSQWGQR
jgi:hypothetical protein